MLYKHKTMILLFYFMPLETNHIKMFQDLGTQNYVLCLKWIHVVL